MNALVKEDFENYMALFAWARQELEGKTVLITGATGLIGSLLAKFLVFANRGIKICAPIRNKSKAESLFSEEERRSVSLVEADLAKCDYSAFVGECDYIIHCAAPTASRYFIEHPVETFDAIVSGTHNLLRFAKGRKDVKGVVYLSSLEVYGENHDREAVIREDFQGTVEIESVRSCYPIAKRATENLCALYSEEYGVPVRIARLTQVTGAGIDMSDNRVFAQFCKRKAERKPIVLHTAGTSSRPYCYTMDAVMAILTILLKGANGKAYNVANESTYISALDLAKRISNRPPVTEFAISLDDTQGYANETYLNLSSERLRRLGWNPVMGLDDIIKRLIDYLSISDETGDIR